MPASGSVCLAKYPSQDLRSPAEGLQLRPSPPDARGSPGAPRLAEGARILPGSDLPVKAEAADQPHDAPPADEEVRRRGRHPTAPPAFSRTQTLLRHAFIEQGVRRGAGPGLDRTREHSIDAGPLLQRAFGELLHLARIERGERFDVIFCDLMMPDMTGMEFYEALLSQHLDLARRMVFMSGGGTTARADDFLRSVRNPKIGKPFTSKRLLETVQQFLVAKQAASAKPS